MQQFLGFAIPGVPYGCTYAIVAVGLVLTYQATGVFNFAFGAQAYTSAFVYTKLVQNDNLPIWLAFLISVVVLAPLLGLAFDHFLFRKIPNTNTTAKLVTGISLFVGIPFLLPVLFGAQNLYNPPSVVFNPNIVYFHVIGTPINGIYLSALVTTALVLIALVILMRFTNLGLQMRGAVESRRLVALDGVNAGRVVATAWAISSFMAGLAGVMLAPLYNQLQFTDYATLLVAAFAAAAWASLRSLPIAALVGILMGVADTVLQGYLPASSTLSAAVIPSLPFIVLVGALLLLPGMRSLDDSKDPLASVDPPPPPTTATLRAPQLSRIIRPAWYVLFAAFCLSMLTWIPQTWESVFNAGLAFSTIFLSITLITGMGGQLSLCQATLAGVGAFTAAQLANHLGLSLLVGGIVGSVLAAVVAVVLAVASLRLKGLGLALMTLAAALFFDNSVFTQGTISNGHALTIESKWVGLGLFNPDGHSLFLLLIVVLVISTLGVLLIRGGTTGQYLSAMRGSETAAAGLGINLTWQRILIFALSGAVAGIGGTLLIIQQESVERVPVHLRALPGLCGHRGDHGGEHRRRGHPGRHGLCGHPAAPHLPAGPIRRQQPDHRPVRLRRPHLLCPPRGHPRIPEASLDPALRATDLRRPGRGRHGVAGHARAADSPGSGPGRSPSAVSHVTLDLSAGERPHLPRRAGR